MNKAGVNRRTFLSTGCAAVGGALFAEEPKATPVGIPLKQEPLAFPFEALEPHLDAATLREHYAYHAESLTRLHSMMRETNLKVGCVSSLMPHIRTMVLPTDPRRTVVSMGGPPPTLTRDARRDLRHYGGAHVNHTAFWRFLAPPGSGPAGPEGSVAEAIARDFGTVDDFKAAFTDACMNHFGSGWGFLVYRPDGRLIVTTLKNDDNPLMKDYVSPEQQGRFILCLDLWEHAYYLKYRQDRRKYIDAWWNVVDWSFVSRAHAIVTAQGKV